MAAAASGEPLSILPENVDDNPRPARGSNVRRASVTRSTVKVNRPSRLVEVLEQGGVPAQLQVQESKGHRAQSTHKDENRQSDMEALMWSYGFAPTQLGEELYPESAAARRAAGQRRGCWLLFLRLNSSAAFTWWCFAVILANAIFMGFEADAKAAYARGQRDSLRVYSTVESVFIGWFIAEGFVRCLGSSVPIYHDRFLIFDIIVVTLSAVELWVLKPLGIMTSGWIVSVFAVFRVLRLTRAVKLVRSVELFRSLYTMLQAVWQSKATFLSVVILLLVLMLIASLFLMALVGPASGMRSESLPQGVVLRFSTLERTMVTLIETLLRGEEWGPNIVRPLLNDEVAWPAGVIFLIFAAFGQFFLLNLISGIFIEAMFKTVRLNTVTLEHEHIYVDQHGAKNLKEAFLKIGGQRKSLSWQEISHGLAMHPDVVMSLGVNLELAEALFNQISFDASDTVDIDEFIFGLINMTRQSKTIDMLVLDYQQQRAHKDVCKLSRRFTVDMERLQLSTHKLARRLSNTLNDCQPLRGTLKARLRRQIERVHRHSMRSKISLREPVEAPGQEGSDSPSSEESPSPRKDGPKREEVPFLGPWLQLLDAEGRPRIRHELDAALGELLAQSRAAGGGAGPAPRPGAAMPPAAAQPPKPAADSQQSQWAKAAKNRRNSLPELPASCLTQPVTGPSRSGPP